MILLRKILYIINALFAFGLLLSYLSYFLPQDRFAGISLLGYAYPLLLVINIGFVVLWIFLKPMHILLSIIIILLRVDYIPRLVNIQTSEDDGQISVLTYNVENCCHKIDNYDPILVGIQMDSILSYIGSTNADIVCLQDYGSNTTWEKGFHRLLTDSLNYTYYYYANPKSPSIRDCAIYSKYPIISYGTIESENIKDFKCIYADIKTPHQSVRVYNLHLASYILGKAEQTEYSNMISGKISKDKGMNIIKKLISANKKRSKEMKELLPKIELSQKATIVCGDFNDHPFSNTYKRMNDILSDSFVAKGRGMGRTYNGVFPAYRIDYIWYEKSRLIPISYSSPSIDFSDHFPVFATFNIKIQ